MVVAGKWEGVATVNLALHFLLQIPIQSLDLDPNPKNHLPIPILLPDLK